MPGFIRKRRGTRRQVTSFLVSVFRRPRDSTRQGKAGGGDDGMIQRLKTGSRIFQGWSGRWMSG